MHSGAVRKRRWANRVAEAVRPRVRELSSADEQVGVERAYSRGVIALAMRIADTMLSAGASANDVVNTVLQVVKRYGVRPVHVDVTYTSITVSFNRGVNEDPLTVTRVVRARTTDYTRLQRLEELVTQIDDGLGLEEALARFAEINVAPHPYRRAVTTLANGGIALGVAVLMGASLVVIVSAVIAAIIVVVIQHELGRRAMPSFFGQAAGALSTTLITIAVTAIARRSDWMEGVRPSIIVAAGIVVLLAGMSVVGAAQDAIDGFYVTAGARILEVTLLTLGIVVGITAGLQLGSRLGNSFLLSSSTPTYGAVHQQLIGSAIIAAGYALSTYARPRAILLGAAMGPIGYSAYLLGSWLRLGPAASSGLGALVGSFLALLVARRLAVPALALITATIVPLVPGSAVFRGLLQLVEANGAIADMTSGTYTLFGAAGVGLALAAGVSLGSYFGRPTRDTLRAAARRIRRDRPR